MPNHKQGGRKRTPTHLKIVNGNPGKRPLPENEPQPQKGIPDPPEHLTDAQRAAWQRFGEALHQVGVLTRLDDVNLELLCSTYVSYCDAIANESKTGPVWIKAPDDPKDFPKFVYSPYWVIKNKAMKQLLSLLTEFGMTPSSRSKVQIAKDKEVESGKKRFFTG